MSKDTLNTPKRTRGDAAQRIYKALREEILTMKLAPAQALDEVGLAERFGVSRSPIREALVRLAASGLVSTLPNKSTIVAPLNIEEFPQFMDALDLLQRTTTRLAAQLRTEQDLETLDHLQQEYAHVVTNNDVVAMIEKNRDFHVAIAQATRNRYLIDAYARLLDEGRRILRLYYRSYNDALPPDTQNNHLPLIEAIRLQDADLAEYRAHEHAMELKQRFLHYMSLGHTLNISVAISH